MNNEQNKQEQNTTFEKTNIQSGTTGISTPQNQTDSANTTVESAKETAKGIYTQAKSTAGQAYGVATQKAAEVLDEKKTGLTDGLSSVADTIRQVGENLRENEDQTPIAGKAAEYGETLAKQIEKVSGYFERNDVRAMVRDVETYARRNPAVFIGAAFAVGLLAARFLKSSPNQTNQYSTENRLKTNAGKTSVENNFSTARKNYSETKPSVNPS